MGLPFTVGSTRFKHTGYGFGPYNAVFGTVTGPLQIGPYTRLVCSPRAAAALL